MTVATSPAFDRSPAAAGSRTRVAIAGATGYAGQELVRILARHPAVTLTAAMSSGATSAPRPLPALARIWDGAIVPLDVERLVADADIVFLALPEAASAELAPVLVERGRRVIDLSGAFRIRDTAARAKWYPATTALPAGTVYGFSERNRDEIRFCREQVGLSCELIYRSVTRRAAQVLRIDQTRAGHLSPRSVADVFAVRTAAHSPAQHLTMLGWRDVELVIVRGIVRLASPTMLTRLPHKIRQNLSCLLIDGVPRWIDAPVEDFFNSAAKVLGVNKLFLSGRPVSLIEEKYVS